MSVEYFVGNLECKGGITSVVVADVASIEEYVGNILYSAEAQEESFALPLVGDKECALIVCEGLAIGVATNKGIYIPSVRKCNIERIVARIGIRIEESPIIVQTIYFACRKRGYDTEKEHY